MSSDEDTVGMEDNEGVESEGEISEESGEGSEEESGEGSEEETGEDNEEDSGEASEEEAGEGNQKSEEAEEGLSGWADSMSKILKSTKPKNKKNLILSRARKDYEINKNAETKPKKGTDMEIAKDGKVAENGEGGDEDFTVKTEQEESDILSAKHQRKLELRQRKLERAWENLNRITTENPDRETEVNLLKIATKGVVQLFNAVAQQQKTLKTKLKSSSKSEFKRDKVLSQSKDLFDKAMEKNKMEGRVGAEESNSEEDDPVEIKQESSTDSDGEATPKKTRKRVLKRSGERSSTSKKPAWGALQDDFMLAAKLKDWDRDSESD